MSMSIRMTQRKHRPVLLILVLANVLLAGCSTEDGSTLPSFGESQCDSEESPRILNEVAAWFANLDGKPFEVHQVGRNNGAQVDLRIFADPGEQRMEVVNAVAGKQAKFEKERFELQTSTTTAWGRSHEPGGAMASEYGDRLADVKQGELHGAKPAWVPSGSNASPGVDYGVECTSWSVGTAWGTEEPVEALRVWATRGSDAFDFVASYGTYGKPAAPLMIQVRDVATLTDVTTTYESHPADRPSYRIGSRGHEVPFVYEFRILESSTNDQGGLYASLAFGNDMPWIPLNEIELHLRDSSTGEVYYVATLRDGTFDMGDGDTAAFSDTDDNGLLDPGDLLNMNLGPGLDLWLYDAAAAEYAEGTSG